MGEAEGLVRPVNLSGVGVQARSRLGLIYGAGYCVYRKTKKMYYMERQTGLKRWTKPRLLGPDDLPDPKDEFRLIKNTEDGRKYWFNPATGSVVVASDSLNFMNHITLSLRPN